MFMGDEARCHNNIVLMIGLNQRGLYGIMKLYGVRGNYIIEVKCFYGCGTAMSMVKG